MAMKDGICPKCGSSAVYHGPIGSVATGWSLKDAAMLPMTMMAGAGLTNYVCTACGYLERYVAAPADRATIAKNWEKVESRDTKS
jgi:hypothetical protein